MRVKAITVSLLFMFLLAPLRGAGAAAPAAEASADKVVVNFPESITFQARFSNSAPIVSATLEYGADQLTCGTVIAKAFPQFQPDTDVSVEWIWDMRQSGSLPPGETVWWRWRIVDSNGQETLTEKKTATWIDSVHKWKTVTDGDLRLHWYEGNQSFAQTLLSSASNGLKRMESDAGLTLDAPVDFYIYANNSDLKDAVLYEPSWTGGLAFPINDIVIIGIATDNLDWGKDTIVHEMTHVLVGHLTFSCLGDMPTWLAEGLAVYSEGELDPSSQEQLDQAIQDDTLISLRSLGGGFSEVRDKAILSYSESYSVVKFLIETYGQEKMTLLLTTLRDGATIDEALQKVYGFDVDGLEREWRKAIGARPVAVSAQPTAIPTPTVVPTIVPVGGAPLAVTPTPFVVPTSSFSPTEPASPVPPGTEGGPPIMLTLFLLGFCCLLVITIGVGVVGLIVRHQNQKQGGSQ